ncbi:TPA: hypothetical protein DCZ39_06215 [Patescibacteria group bacterium]|nr:hypothetical protein [Candidatus Gracilibacteria bacterium]
MYNTLPVKPMSYFSGGKYDTSELENFVNIFVFTKKISVNKPFTRVQLPLSKTLMEDFNLGCISESKISSITCNHYLNNFLDSFFVYTLALDYPGLKNIFDAIKNNANQKERFCG